MSNGPQFFQTGYGRTYFEQQLPDQIEAMNRLAAAIEKQNELNTPDNEYSIKYKENYRSSWKYVTVFAKTKDDAAVKFLKEMNYEVHESEATLVRLGG